MVLFVRVIQSWLCPISRLWDDLKSFVYNTAGIVLYSNEEWSTCDPPPSLSELEQRLKHLHELGSLIHSFLPEGF